MAGSVCNVICGPDNGWRSRGCVVPVGFSPLVEKVVCLSKWHGSGHQPHPHLSLPTKISPSSPDPH